MELPPTDNNNDVTSEQSASGVPKDRKLTARKKLAIIWMHISCMSTLPILTVEILYICMERLHSCTFYTDEYFRGVVVTIIGFQCVGTLCGCGPYLNVLYGTTKYESRIVVILEIARLFQLVINLLVWSLTSAAQALEKNYKCRIFAITCFSIISFGLVVHVITIIVLVLFRTRMIELNPNLVEEDAATGFPAFTEIHSPPQSSEELPPPPYARNAQIQGGSTQALPFH